LMARVDKKNGKRNIYIGIDTGDCEFA